MSNQKAYEDLDLFSPREHPLPDGGYDMLLEVLDVQDAAADLTKARIRCRMSDMPGAGGYESVEICEERFLREVDDYNRKADMEKPQPKLFNRLTANQHG